MASNRHELDCVDNIPSDAVPHVGVAVSSGHRLERQRRGGSGREGRILSALRPFRKDLKDLYLAAARAQDFGELLAVVAAKSSAALQTDFCEVLELEEHGRSLVLRSGAGLPDEIVGHARVGTSLHSQAGYTLLRGRPVISENLGAEERFDVSALLADNGAVSGVTVPILETAPHTGGNANGIANSNTNGNGERPGVDDEPRSYGVLGVYCRTERTYSQDEVDFLVEAARVLAGAYWRQDAEQAEALKLQEIRERTARLEDHHAYETEVLETLCHAADDAEAVAGWAARMAVPHLADWCFVDLLDYPVADRNGRTSGSLLRLPGRDAGGEKRFTGDLAGWYRIRRAAVGHPPTDQARQLAVGMLGDGEYPVDATSRYGPPKVLRSGRVQHLPEVTEKMFGEISASPESLDVLRGVGATSYVGVPLQSGGRPLGIIGFIRSGEREAFSPQDLGHISRYSLMLSSALGSALGGALGGAEGPDSGSPTGDLPANDRSPLGELAVNQASSEGSTSVGDLDANPLEVLTPRQIEVFELIAQGKTNRQIADELFLSPGTVKTHLRRAGTALGIVADGKQGKARRELVQFAIRYYKYR